MIIGTKPTPGDATLTLCTTEPPHTTVSTLFDLPPAYVAMMFDDLASVPAAIAHADA